MASTMACNCLQNTTQTPSPGSICKAVTRKPSRRRASWPEEHRPASTGGFTPLQPFTCICHVAGRCPRALGCASESHFLLPLLSRAHPGGCCLPVLNPLPACRPLPASPSHFHLTLESLKGSTWSENICLEGGEGEQSAWAKGEFSLVGRGGGGLATLRSQ